MRQQRHTAVITLLFALACQSGKVTTSGTTSETAAQGSDTDQGDGTGDDGGTGSESGDAGNSGDDGDGDDTKDGGADVVEVAVSGSKGAYTFAVSLLSHDTGCDHYADWWEVLDGSGGLVYRRILNHSHVDEQPFTRSGDEMNVTANETLIVRGHMNDSGYGGVAFSGTVDDGFTKDPKISADYAASVENKGEQPKKCWY